MRKKRKRSDPPKEKPDAEAQPSLRPFEQRVRAFIHLTRDLEMTPVVMTQPIADMKNEWSPGWMRIEMQQKANAAIRQIAGEENCALIDLAKHIEENVENWDQPMVVFYDGIHVSDNGSQIYAHYITNSLTPLLQGGGAAKD